MIFAMGPNVALILLLLGTHTVNTVDAKNRDHWISVYNHWEVKDPPVIIRNEADRPPSSTTTRVT